MRAHNHRTGFLAALLLLLGSIPAALAGIHVRAAPVLSPSQDNIVISEFRASGPNPGFEDLDDFVEIFNPTSQAIDISGWKVVSVSSTGIHKKIAQLYNGTVLSPGQHYLITGAYYSGSVHWDMKFSIGGILDTGGVALLDSNGVLIDMVGVSPSAAEGTPLPAWSGTLDQSYERKAGGPDGSCVDTDDNNADFLWRSPSDPQNSTTSALTVCAATAATETPTSTPTSTETEATTSTVTATATFTPTFNPTGTDTPTWAVTDTFTPNFSSTKTFTSTRTSTFTWTPSPTKTLSPTRTDTLTRTASATRTFSPTRTASMTRTQSPTQTFSPTRTQTPYRTATATRTPVNTPIPGFVAINEFLPRPNSDWNEDGEVNVHDEYIELINLGATPVSLKNWSLDAGAGTYPFALPNVSLLPRQILVFFHFETGVPLQDSGGSVRLVQADGKIADTFSYPPVSTQDRTWCLLPGEIGGLAFACTPTPGRPNKPFTDASASLNAGFTCSLPDSVPAAVSAAECHGIGAGIWRHPWEVEFWLARQEKWDVYLK